MSEVLVVVDAVDGAVRKPTLELLALAKKLGTPSAVYFGGNDSAVTDKLKAFGAEKIYVVDDAEIKGYLVAPKAEALQQLVEKTSPAAVLLVSGYEGKEIAGRLAIKTGSVRRQLHREVQGHQGHPDHHGQAQLRRPGGDRRSR